MNKKVLIGILSGIILISIVVILVIVLKPNKKTYKYGDIESFTYNFGSGEGEWNEYSITVRNGEYYLKGLGYNTSNIEIDTYLNDSDMKKLNDIIKDNNISRWDGFNESDENVLDGYGFRLVIKYKNGDKIEAHGYMKYPENYKKGHNALVDFLESFNY